MIPVLTSLATIQSHPFAMRFAVALAMRSSVSAAKPITSDGRFAWRARPARISGFSASLIVVGASRFLSFEFAAVSGRQSATAAVHTAMSAGNCASHAVHICRAVSTRTSFTRGGGVSSDGPETSTVSAPASASADAIA